MNLTTGKLILVGTPIGNVEDITYRALKTLLAAEILVCEDTRVTARLLEMIKSLASEGNTPKTKAKLYRVDEYTEMKMVVSVANWLDAGKNVVLVTDAGMPAVSDPGYKMVAAIRNAGYEVEVIPGVSALTMAMSLSGLNTSKTLFVGFLDKGKGKREKGIERIKQAFESGLITVVIIYESPNRLEMLLEELVEILPNFQVRAGGELTKMYQKVLVGKPGEVLTQLNEMGNEIKGEWAVVVGK